MPQPRILLVRTSALGDVVHCLPVLTALRRSLPAARIAWVVEEAMAPVLAGHPDLDTLITVRLRPWRRNPLARTTRREVFAALGALRDFAPDVALDLMGNHKGALLAALSGAHRVIGLGRRHRREPSSALWIDRPVEPDLPSGGHLHAVDRALALLPALGVATTPVDFGGDKLFRDAPEPQTEPGPFAVIHPGAGWANKVYAPQHWGEVARRLWHDAGLPTRVPVAPGEEDLADAVVAASGGTARREPAAGLAGLAALLRGARLVLAGDTGPLHLAHALGAPVLAVHGPTDPRRHGPYGAPGRSVWTELPCSFCYKRFDETKACLKLVPAERVARRALELLTPSTATS